MHSLSSSLFNRLQSLYLKVYSTHFYEEKHLHFEERSAV